MEGEKKEKEEKEETVSPCFYCRLAKVKFVEDNKMLSSTFVFTAEPKPLEYVSHKQSSSTAIIYLYCRSLKYVAVMLVSPSHQVEAVVLIQPIPVC